MASIANMPSRASLAGRWQSAAFLAGVAILGLGFHRITSSNHPLTFEDEMHRAALLSEAGALTRLNAYLIYLLKDVERPAKERAEIHRLLVGAIHTAEAECELHKQENVHSIISNFDKAVSFGAKPTGMDWIALGDAYLWLGRDEEGLDALRQALRLGASRPDTIRRRIFEMETAHGALPPEEAIHELDGIIEDEKAGAANFAWAADLKARLQLRRGETQAALSLVEQAKTRLEGTPERPAMTYLEALCLKALGRRDEADTMVRSLRDGLADRDELWGRSGWLLGELELEDGRPQSGMAFFDEVLAAFSKGPLHDACELGRAQALVALEREEAALEAFKSVREGMPNQGDHEFVDRDAVRMLLTTIGRDLLDASKREMGVQYLQLALAYVGEGDEAVRARYLTQIASALRAEAKSLEAGDGKAESVERIKSLSVRAAEASLALAKLEKLDLDRAAEAMEAAAEDLDRAGEMDRMIEVLQSYVDRFPIEQVESGRARAYLKLARAFQAKSSYRDAIDAYGHVIQEFPRQPEALDSMVPRAACYLRLGGSDAAKGEELLIEIVDDLGAESVFTPTAQEYRDALIMLGEHYVLPDIGDASAKDPVADESRLVKGVTRLEDALALYPTEQRVPRLRFFLAEAYRRSGEAVAANASPTDAGARREVDRRLRKAHENYGFVRDHFARMDTSELSELEKTYLRASYLYVGDCLFDLNEVERAVEAYRETAWRYENEPTAVAAMMQVVNCYYRLGRADEAKAALARMNWLLKKIPDSAFTATSAMTPKSYWQDMVMRLERAETN